ncbi:MAG: putative signaling protein [Hyphomonas sp. TMED17]|nr:MAG: putative signaling protein [Hyphomonas sp. TMED17]
MSENTQLSGRLLILDDEYEVAATICMMATTDSYHADFTDNASDFIEKVTSWNPTHVMVDLQLADRDGIEIIHLLAEMGCQAGVIIISGLGGRILNSSARAASENGLHLVGTLAKPFSRSDLLTMLTSDTGRATTRRQSLPRSAVSYDQIEQALREKSFITHFQPKICCFTGELKGYECLARWPQHDGTMIPPDQFIRVAEDAGLIDALTRQVYDYALANLPSPPQSTSLKYALNLSPVNLNDETFPRWLLDKCQEYDIAPSRIILELTETASMNKPLTLLESLTQFRIRGFQLSIDDFGVGYSSLVQLARLPFSELKIDQMFVRNLASSDESHKIVSAVVGLGKSLGLNVVAEGVEDAHALDCLRELGCDEAQGYFIARPMDNNAALTWTGLPTRDSA